jgi:hypothetical protein
MTAQEWKTSKEKTLASIQTRIDFVVANWDRLIAADVEPANINPYCESVDIDRPTREQVMSVIQAFPGKWEKSPGYGEVPTIDYTLSGCPSIRLWHAPPPPTCKIVEEDVEIPAQPARVEKRKRLVCGEGVNV